MKKCPCEKCICRSMCKHKEYAVLVHECNIVWKYITCIPMTTFNDDPFQVNPYLVKVFNTLKPEKWMIRGYHGSNVDVSLIESKRFVIKG